MRLRQRYPLQVAIFHNLNHRQRATLRTVVQRLAPAVRHTTVVRRKLDTTPAPIAAGGAFRASFFFELAHYAVNDGRCFIPVHGRLPPFHKRADAEPTQHNAYKKQQQANNRNEAYAFNLSRAGNA
jgi:hypothetical protein